MDWKRPRLQSNSQKSLRLTKSQKAKLKEQHLQANLSSRAHVVFFKVPRVVPRPKRGHTPPLAPQAIIRELDLKWSSWNSSCHPYGVVVLQAATLPAVTPGKALSNASLFFLWALCFDSRGRGGEQVKFYGFPYRN